MHHAQTSFEHPAGMKAISPGSRSAPGFNHAPNLCPRLVPAFGRDEARAHCLVLATEGGAALTPGYLL